MDQEAVYILNRRVYKESSLILDIFSPNYGRLSVIANGALKSKKGWSALLQVFQPLLMVWAGKSSLKTLVTIDAPSAPIFLQGRRLFSAYYLNELLVKLLPQDQFASTNFTALFIAYAKSLQDLAAVAELELPLREFEYHLLSNLGVLPDFECDTDGNLIAIDSWYKFIPSMGFTPVPYSNLRNQTSSSAYYFGAYLLNFTDFSSETYLDKEFALQIKRLMRLLIQDLLGGRELKSRALFQAYQPFRSSK